VSIKIDINTPVVRLCVEGTQAEFQGQIDQARICYERAWDAVQDDYDACIAAHYLARHQEDPEERLYWNQVALDKADAVGDERVQDFYPSLYLNLGQSYELVGDQPEAQRYFGLAAKLGVDHRM